jgi:hypothetical protein
MANGANHCQPVRESPCYSWQERFCSYNLSRKRALVDHHLRFRLQGLPGSMVASSSPPIAVVERSRLCHTSHGEDPHEQQTAPETPTIDR